ncbi:MAG: hypothetical protein O7B99_03620 [Planctomycetota bacterium]|nr:hypothetical protein [Planctomycetota bacterium]
MKHDPLRLDRGLSLRLERIGQDFLADILERETARHPDNLAALSDLAHALTLLGRLEDGLAVDRRLVRLEPENPVLHYNLACSLALLERTDEAFEVLHRAVEVGYDDLEHLLQDEDLANLRGDSRYDELVALLR